MRSRKILELPGLVDVHVHLREPGAIHKEDFETGTKAAIAGGYTQILDMPNNQPPTVTPQALSQKIKLAKKRIWCDLGFNFGGTLSSIFYFKKVYQKVFGLKIYMNRTTGILLVDKNNDRDIVFKSWVSNLPIMVHAEGETVEIAIMLAKKYKKPLHICHVTYDQINAVEKSRKDGVKITCEVTPHHLFLNTDDLKRLGPLAIMKPPLLTKFNQKKLWDSLNKIDMISTDHAPHTLEEKNDQSVPIFGVPGLETTLPLMLMAVARGLLTIERLIEMTSTKPRQIFKLPNQTQTSITVDISKTYLLSEVKLFTKCAWTPFAHLKGQGRVKKVILRGKTVFLDGRFIGKPQGQIIYPAL